MVTVGRLARQFGLSRSTLLYYDKIGLLCPSGRSSANYRLYTDADVKRLDSICQLRETGLSLDEVCQVLETQGDRTTEILERHLEGLNEDIAKLREQQRIVVKLLRSRSSWKRTRALDKKGWVAILRAAGLDEDDMSRWHREFEHLSPEGHQDFLESLGIPESEIELIRRWSRKDPEGPRR